jgi:hypothetical protein
MNRAVVALLVSVSLLGCFPHSARNRTYAKIGEGGALAAGIALSAFANSAADCDSMEVSGVNDQSGCRSNAKWASTAGVVLVLGGLLGFVATVSTAEDDNEPKPVEIKDVSQKPETPALAPPPGVKKATDGTDAQAAGSATPSPSAPQR